MNRICRIIILFMSFLTLPSMAAELVDEQYERNMKLVDSIRGDDEQLVKKLLDEGADPNFPYPYWPSTTGGKDSTLLIEAIKQEFNRCYAARMAIINHLLDAGARVNDQNIFGTRVLPASIENVDDATFAKLLEKGADVNVRLCGEQMTPLMLAVQRNKKNKVQQLLKKGAKINEQSQDGMTPLYYGVKYGLISLVKELITAGANPELGEETYNKSTGLTAFEYETIKRLLINNENIDQSEFDVDRAENIVKEAIARKRKRLAGMFTFRLGHIYRKLSLFTSFVTGCCQLLGTAEEEKLPQFPKFPSEVLANIHKHFKAMDIKEIIQ